MMKKREFLKYIAASSAVLSAPSILRAQSILSGNQIGEVYDDNVDVVAQNAHRFNNSAFRTQRWQDHFSSVSNGGILVDIDSFALHYWNQGQGIYRQYPIAIPLKSEFERRGRTQVTQKVDGPSWRPTAAMLKRDPTLPSYVGPGPENPLGTHALYLSWEYYRIHGNNDTRKIGRRASSGCIGLFNEHIAELFGLVDVGCQVKVI